MAQEQEKMQKMPILWTVLLIGLLVGNAAKAAESGVVETSMSDVSMQTNTIAKTANPVHIIIEKQLKAFRDRDAKAAQLHG